MKLTSSGNVMLVTFSFSRQRHGAIFKAYFQAIPKAGECLPSMPFWMTSNIWLRAVYHSCRQNAEAFCQLGMAPWYPLTILHTTLQTWTVTGRSGWVEARDGSHVLTLLLSVSAHGLWTVFTARGGDAPSLAALLCLSASFEGVWLWFLFQAPLPGYLLSITIVMLDIQDSPTTSSCEKDWLEIGGVKWVSPVSKDGKLYASKSEGFVILVVVLLDILWILTSMCRCMFLHLYVVDHTGACVPVPVCFPPRSGCVIQLGTAAGRGSTPPLCYCTFTPTSLWLTRAFTWCTEPSPQRAVSTLSFCVLPASAECMTMFGLYFAKRLGCGLSCEVPLCCGRLGRCCLSCGGRFVTFLGH